MYKRQLATVRRRHDVVLPPLRFQRDESKFIRRSDGGFSGIDPGSIVGTVRQHRSNLQIRIGRLERELAKARTEAATSKKGVGVPTRTRVSGTSRVSFDSVVTERLLMLEENRESPAAAAQLDNKVPDVKVLAAAKTFIRNLSGS